MCIDINSYVTEYNNIYKSNYNLFTLFNSKIVATSLHYNNIYIIVFKNGHLSDRIIL